MVFIDKKNKATVNELAVEKDEFESFSCYYKITSLGGGVFFNLPCCFLQEASRLRCVGFEKLFCLFFAILHNA